MSKISTPETLPRTCTWRLEELICLRARFFPVSPLSKATLSGVPTSIPGYNILHHLLISLTWHQIPVIFNFNDSVTNTYIGTHCAQTWKVPLVPTNYNAPLMLWPDMMCGCSSSHVLYLSLSVSNLFPSSVSLVFSGSLWLAEIEYTIKNWCLQCQKLGQNMIPPPIFCISFISIGHYRLSSVILISTYIR